jgi:hypothetical protein
MASECRTGGTTVTPVNPVVLPEMAEIVALPTLTACARPELLMVTNAVAVELQVTDAVILLEVPSLNCPSALYCCDVPFGREAPAGVTVMATSVAEVTVSFVEALALPDAALMVVLPGTSAAANPAALIVATAVAEEVHVTELVTSCMLPSVKVPVAVNCCICPVAIEGFAGMIVSDTRAAGPTVALADPVMLPEVAITFALPALTACARPELLTVIVAGALEVHVAEAVKSFDEPLLNSPSALNCCEVPLGRDAPDGVTVMEVRTSTGGVVPVTALDEPPQALATKQTASRQAIASTDRYRFGMQIKLMLLRESSPGVVMKTSHVVLSTIVPDFDK